MRTVAEIFNISTITISKLYRRYRRQSVKDRPRSGRPLNPHLWRTDLNAERCINGVLQPVAVPYVERHPNTISRNDSARPHRARVVYQFLEEHDIERIDP